MFQSSYLINIRDKKLISHILIEYRIFNGGKIIKIDHSF